MEKLNRSLCGKPYKVGIFSTGRLAFKVHQRRACNFNNQNSILNFFLDSVNTINYNQQNRTVTCCENCSLCFGPRVCPHGTYLVIKMAVDATEPDSLPQHQDIKHILCSWDQLVPSDIAANTQIFFSQHQ